jgi:eukaryotic-like serine/threonine-protein kinase
MRAGAPPEWYVSGSGSGLRHAERGRLQDATHALHATHTPAGEGRVEVTRAPGGLVADRYEVEALVGSGGMGEVFRARDRSLGEVVALKSIFLEGLDAVATLRRFREEVRLARRVTHNNVARVYDLVEEPSGSVYLTMELVDGITLNELLEREGPLPLIRGAQIGVQVCAGLAAVHAAGIVHRDLKPTNILVEESGRAVITDFGVARNVRDPVSLGLGAVVGTPSYMAPEQARGGAVDWTADVYALGVTLSEMFFERPPLVGRAHWLQNAELLPELKAALLACLATDPRARPSPDEVGKVLGLLVDRSEVRRSEPNPVALANTRRLETLADFPVEPTNSNVVASPPTKASSARARSEIAVVVLPFRLTGNAKATGPDALGEVIAEELTDVLSCTNGLRVLAASAATRFGTDRDPIRIGRELRVQTVIDGTLRITGESIRMGVRLIDAESGSQLWTENFDGSLGDLFSFEGVVAKRVAERLRLRVELVPFDGAVPAEAVRSYLDARVARRTPSGLGETLRLLERALELAPDLAPALAAHAMVSLIAWFVPFAPTPGDWEGTCATRVERALSGAPEQAESHVADALLAWEQGRLKEATTSLGRALRLAPTSGEALSFLGELEGRAGYAKSAVTHSTLAWNLDPSRYSALTMLAREEFFSGRFKEGMTLLDSLGQSFAPPAFLLRVRAASWFGDEEEIRSCLTRAWSGADSGGGLAFGNIVARAFLGETRPGEIGELAESLLAMGKSPRLCAEVLAVSTEVEAKAGHLALAFSHLDSLANHPAFFDLDWLERCPGLAPMRESASFRSAKEIARTRVSRLFL